MSHIGRSNIEENPLAGVTGRITIELGFNNDGQRAITTLFEDLMDLDEDENPHLLPYMDGKLMLGAASDEFFYKHYFEEQANE